MVSQLSLEQKAFRDSCATEGSTRTQTLYPATRTLDLPSNAYTRGWRRSGKAAWRGAGRPSLERTVKACVVTQALDVSYDES